MYYETTKENNNLSERKPYFLKIQIKNNPLVRVSIISFSFWYIFALLITFIEFNLENNENNQNELIFTGIFRINNYRTNGFRFPRSPSNIRRDTRVIQWQKSYYCRSTQMERHREREDKRERVRERTIERGRERQRDFDVRYTFYYRTVFLPYLTKA